MTIINVVRKMVHGYMTYTCVSDAEAFFQRQDSRVTISVVLVFMSCLQKTVRENGHLRRRTPD